MMRKCLMALCLLLALCAGARAAERYVVQAGGVSALVDAGGREVLSGADIAAIFEVRPGALYAAGREGDYALYDADGEQLGETRFQMIDDMDGALVFRAGGLYGAMDAQGNVLEDPLWAQLVSDGAGGFLALQTSPLDEQPDEVFRIAADGALNVTGSVVESGLSPLHEGRMAFRAADGRYGCLNAAGMEAIPAEWAWAGDFQDGAAPVSDGALYGLIDLDGALRVPPKYVWLQRGEGLLAGLTEDGVVEVLSPDGLRLLGAIPTASGDVSLAGRWIAVREADGAALYDAGGVRRVEAGRDALFFPGLNGQVIVSDGNWGEYCQWLAGADGAAVSGRYQRLLPLTGARYAFITFADDYGEARCGLLDDHGNERLPAAYREIVPAGEDRLMLVGEEAVWFADLDGKVIRSWTGNRQ